MKFIDVSNHNGDIDFEKVKASGIEGVIIKASEGKTYKDPYFHTNYSSAKAADLYVGTYHFLRNNATEDEINNFLDVIDGLDFDCKIVIDVEVDLGGVSATSAKVRAFADALNTKGYQVVLYSGAYFYRDNLNDNIKDIPLWVASYGKPPIISGYIGWQYTETGSVDGINGYVDMNDFEEDILLMKKYYIVTNYLPVTKYGVEIVSIISKYFEEAKRLYIKSNNRGMWIETQYFDKATAQIIADRLRADNLFWDLIEE